jgi:hypothetical protein
LIVATERTLEAHVAALIVAEPTVADTPVRFTVVPLEVVPIAISPAVWLAAVSVSEAGTMARDARGSETVPETDKLALAATTLPSGFV